MMSDRWKRHEANGRADPRQGQLTYISDRYTISRDADGQRWIQCARCHAKSYHPADIATKYCGMCHEFLEER